MTEGFRPLGQHGVKKFGACGLCGNVGLRSRTHVPPEAAGNNQPSATIGTRTENGVSVIEPGRRRDGGSAGWFLCESCNGITGGYDEEFIRWWKMLVMDWPNIQSRKSGDTRVGAFPAGKPGSFIRSVLGGMFAFNPSLLPRYQEVAAAILSGEPGALPPELCLLMSHYRGDVRYVLGQFSIIRTPRNGDSLYAESVALDLQGEWAWPPFHLALTNASGVRRWPQAMNISAWLGDRPADMRDVSVVVGVLDEVDLSAAHFGSNQQ